ncbi:MAG: URC4/urg3 family protein [Casimicrobiaceae bacterium]
MAAISAAALKSAAAIRERCGNIAAAVTAGNSRHFHIDRTRIPAAAERVADVTRRRYPDLAIPYHSRWRHFEAGGRDRRAELDRPLPAADRARMEIDLTVVSVLLDAGAGPAWGYVEAETGQRYTRSEGLGVASFRAFAQGAFSATPGEPWRVDAAALAAIDAGKLGALFQVSDANPLVGLEGRAALLRRLGRALVEQQETFGTMARPGALFDRLTYGSQRNAVNATAILRELLDGLGSIWLTGSTFDGVALGDVWQHPHAGGVGPTAGWVPFHKLSQWLAYSLFEPYERAGFEVTRRDELTGLPEYRNGGLLLDTGVLALRNDADALVAWDVGSALVVEWRALTVALLDELAPQVRQRLGAPALPLACILEGGTWAAGRELAMALRGGDPPLAITSDGTVF